MTGHVESILLLLEAGAEKDLLNNEGNGRMTPLHVAAQWGNLDVVRYLVEVGADKNQANNQGATVL